jgi:hypothetical protein
MIANLFVDLAVGSYVWYTIYLKTRPSETSCSYRYSSAWYKQAESGYETESLFSARA